MSISPKLSIPLSVPFFQGKEIAYLQDAIRSTWVSSQGPYVTRFEKSISRYSRTPLAVAAVNGTAALHTALMTIGLEPNEEVLVPALSFVATANVVKYCSAHPVFMDVDWESWTMDPFKVREFVENQCTRRQGRLINRKTHRRVRALLPVHVLGHPADMDPLIKLAHTYGLSVIEDACEALGATYKGRPVGGLSDIGCFSFNGNKVITSGGGGMIVTHRKEYALRARYLTTQAKDDPNEYIHREVGYNYRLTNIQAALGCAQLEQLPAYLKQKEKIAARYKNAFKKIPGINIMPSASWAKPTHWLFTIRLSPPFSSKTLVRYLLSQGIEARLLWYPLHLLPMYRREMAYDIEVAPKLYKEAVSLPSSIGLTEGHQEKVIRHVRSFLKL